MCTFVSHSAELPTQTDFLEFFRISAPSPRLPEIILLFPESGIASPIPTVRATEWFSHYYSGRCYFCSHECSHQLQVPTSFITVLLSPVSVRYSICCKSGPIIRLTCSSNYSWFHCVKQ